MYSKKILIIPLLLLLAVSLAGAKEKWNIVVAQWEDLSPKKDGMVGIILRKSVISALSQNSNFQIKTELKMYPVIREWGEAVDAGRQNEADVIIYGTFYVENEKIAVTAEVFDVLTEQLKLRQTYTGEVTIEIFDTINEITADLAGNVSAVLPEFTTESEVEIQKIREVVYAKGKVNMKRTFYTRLGFTGEGGMKTVSQPEYNGAEIIVGYNDVTPCYQFQAGLGARFNNFRVDVFATGFPGMPSYLGSTYGSKFGNIPTAPSSYDVSFTYYLPFWNRSLAVGWGIHGFGYLRNNFDQNSFDKNGFLNFETTTMDWLAHCLQFYVNPNDRWEFSLYISPVPSYSASREPNNSDRSGSWDYKIVYFPNCGGSVGFFFLPTLGVELGFHLAHFYSESGWEGTVIGQNPDYLAETVIAAGFLNIIYRLDFK